MEPERNKGKWSLPNHRYLAGLFILVGIVLVLWVVPEWQAQYHSENVTDESFPLLANEYRKTIAQIIGGFLLLVGVYLNWRRITAVEQEVRSSEDRQITERFTRAIEQLGNSRLEVRLGGIYSLERIAKDSKKDHWTVMEVLTAFIRENARWEGEGAEPEDVHSGEEAIPTSSPSPSPSPPPPPSKVVTKTDIQAALSVICRRQWIDAESGPIDLHGTDLRGYDLTGGFLEKAHLTDTHLENAILRNA